MIALALALSTATCPPRTYLNGVRPDGRYTCRSVPSHDDPPAERKGILVEDRAIETHGRIHCPAGSIAFAADFRHVACRSVR